jgi:hypothetical protein
MRQNFLFKFKNADEDDLHSVPIQDMGNYHEYLKNQAPPLRELETQLVRQHMFGNPFKLVSKDQKQSMFGADEIDEVYEESAENHNQFQQQQKVQAISNNKRSIIGGPASKRRGGMKGPLSRKINYMKHLYSSNSNTSGGLNGNISSASSTVNDSDIEILDDISSTASFTMASSISEDLNDSINKQNQHSTNDVADLNDFNDIPVIINEVETIETIDDLDIYKQQQQQQIQSNLRPQSASSTSSTSSSGLSNELEMNFNFLNPNVSSLCDNYLEQSYIQLKILCLEQIKKPGSDHSRLFQLIHDSHLTLSMRLFLVKELIFEASRFRRSHLIELLIKFSNILQQLAIANNKINSTKMEFQQGETN